MHPSRLPLLHLNLALDERGGHTGALSCAADLRRVHALREAVDAVAVGAGTFRTDRPRLSARPEHLGRQARRQPTRVVLGGNQPVEDPLPGAAPLLVCGPVRPTRADAWLRTPPRRLAIALVALRAAGIRNVLLEGGPTIWFAALHEGLVDRLTAWIATPDPRRAAEVVRQVLPLPAGVPAWVHPLGVGHVVEFQPRLRRVTTRGPDALRHPELLV